MIRELVFVGVLFVLGVLALILLAQEERLEEMSERRAVNRMADKNRRSKPHGMRPRCRYIRAGLQK